MSQEEEVMGDEDTYGDTMMRQEVREEVLAVGDVLFVKKWCFAVVPGCQVIGPVI